MNCRENQKKMMRLLLFRNKIYRIFKIKLKIKKKRIDNLLMKFLLKIKSWKNPKKECKSLTIKSNKFKMKLNMNKKKAPTKTLQLQNFKNYLKILRKTLLKVNRENLI